MFIRGEKFRMQTNTNVIAFINHLNDGNVSTVKEIKEDFLIDWNDDATFKLLYALYKRKGIEISD
ncbi:hypothetical protein [Kordia sp.]|uniref:hypothetical protein n=1 Tax=Kordia sp. TaxID=1965332 RepID=UPI003D29009E